MAFNPPIETNFRQGVCSVLGHMEKHRGAGHWREQAKQSIGRNQYIDCRGGTIALVE